MKLCWPQLVSSCVQAFSFVLPWDVHVCVFCLFPFPKLIFGPNPGFDHSEQGGSRTEPLLHPPPTAVPSAWCWPSAWRWPHLPSVAWLPSGPWQLCCWMRVRRLICRAGPCAQPSVVVLGVACASCCPGCSPQDQLCGPGSACGSHSIAPGPRETL